MVLQVLAVADDRPAARGSHVTDRAPASQGGAVPARRCYGVWRHVPGGDRAPLDGFPSCHVSVLGVWQLEHDARPDAMANARAVIPDRYLTLSWNTARVFPAPLKSVITGTPLMMWSPGTLVNPRAAHAAWAVMFLGSEVRYSRAQPHAAA